MSSRLKWGAWVVLLVVLSVSLVIGARRPGPASTATQRTASIDAELRCPSCDGISVADSSAATAVAIRSVVAERVKAGESTAQIVSFLEARYGQGILLAPPASGGTAAVWVLPVVGVGLGAAALGIVFWRRARVGRVVVSAEDRALVEEALRQERSRAPA
jgi:cytochrome c-type biogenesis protein CcmH